METPTSTIVQTGDLGGEKVAMSFDANAMNHIMSILTDMYSDAELACIREYSTNALDAHIEAGNKAPIEVFTPNALSPYFRVKDSGVGLSKADIINMYSKYGASTKRGTNDQVGMLGIGAKSALSLVPQFSLISVKDGVRIVVSISRNAQNAGQMEIIAESETDEPNGVEISIPVPRTHNFAQKCRDFFRFWQPGTVLVDGKEPEFIPGRPVGDNFIVNHNLDQDYIVMGNVAYPCKESLYEHGYSYRQIGIVAFVDIGDVNFTPSREQLHYTPKTKETIRRIQKEFTSKLTTAAQADIDAAPSHAEAWKRAQQWNTSFHNRLGAFAYKGSKIPSDIPFMKDPNAATYSSQTVQGKSINIVGRTPRYNNWVRTVNPTMQNEFIFVTGFAESLKISATQRNKVAIYVAQQGWNVSKIALFKQDEIITDPVHLAFLEDIKIVKWEEIAKIKVARAQSARAVKTDPYELYVGRYTLEPVSGLDTTKEIIYISPAENRQPSHLPKIFPDAQIVMLGINRWDKFKRDFPTAKHYEKAIEARRADLISQLTREDKIWMKFDTYSRRGFEVFKGAEVDDPALAEFVKVFSGTRPTSPVIDALKALPGYSSQGIEEIDNPLTKYPLASSISHGDRAHAIWYVNSYYAHLTNTKEN